VCERVKGVHSGLRLLSDWYMLFKKQIA
jgi:hypothetical protein